MRKRRIGSAAAALALCAAMPAMAQDEAMAEDPRPTARADIVSQTGEMLGTATLTELPMGGVLIELRLEGVPPGEHAFHIHENGVCEPPDFESAGGHFNPYEVGHGFYDGDGVHAGDLPNVFVEEDGVLRADMIAPDVTTTGAGLNSVLTGDGTAFVMHRDPDDYSTDPAGASGPRIACGVIGTITEGEGEGDEAGEQ